MALRQPRPQSSSQGENERQSHKPSAKQPLSRIAGHVLLPAGPTWHPAIRGSSWGWLALGSGRALLLAAALLLANQAPALAGSVTAESIWDRSNAIQRATSQIPQGATVTGSSCQEVDLRGGSTRYICTVTYSSPPAPSAPKTAAPNQ